MRRGDDDLTPDDWRAILLAVLLGVAVAVVCSSCGLLNAGMASAGMPGADTPEARNAAQQADAAAWNWLGYALFGVGGAAAGGTVTHRHHRRKQKAKAST